MLTSRAARPILVSCLALTCGLFTPAEAQAADSKVQGSLVRPAAGVDPDAVGSLRLLSQGEASLGRQEWTAQHVGDIPQERFRLNVKHVDALLAHDLYIETAPRSNSFLFVASLSPHGNGLDEMVFTADTSFGDVLPGGASNTAELAGRKLEVRVGQDTILHGPVPAFGLPLKLKGTSRLTQPPVSMDAQMDGKIKLRAKPQKGDQLVEVSIENLPLNPVSFHLFMGNRLGTMTDLGVFVQAHDPDGDPNRYGNLHMDDDLVSGLFRLSMKDGDALPFGVWSMAALEGRPIEVRDALGNVFLEGSVPALE